MGFSNRLVFLLIFAPMFSIISTEEMENEDFFSVSHIHLKLGEESSEYVTECGQYTYFKVDVTNSCEDLNIQVIQIEGEPNLYVSRPPVTHPTYHSLSWSSYEWGSENMTISSWDPNFSIGPFYIAIHAYCGEDVQTKFAPAQYRILVQTLPHTHPRTEDIFNKTVEDVISAKEYKYYRFCLPSGCQKVTVGIENCNNPHECPETYSYPELIISPTEEQPTVNSYGWMLGEVEHRSITLDTTDPTVHPGHFYVAVYGWCTPNELCPDPSTCGPCDIVQNLPYTISVTPQDACDSATNASTAPEFYSFRMIYWHLLLLGTVFTFIMN